ncbi:MAG: acyltransferase [Methylacidiphilales bacterium]|nr:acyltransferase [Candidatus Methylacidiphilales bacterium]
MNLPYKACYRCHSLIHSFIFKPFQPLLLRLHGVEGADGCRLFGLPVIMRHPESKIIIGKNWTARSSFSSNSIGSIQPVLLSTTSAKSLLRIGNDVGMSGCTVSCQENIEIEDRVMIGSGVLLLDNDSHSLDPEERFSEIPNIRSLPIHIGRDAFIGARAILLKGTRIGARSIIQAGSVVSGNFPDDCIIGGNPAAILSRKQ